MCASVPTLLLLLLACTSSLAINCSHLEKVRSWSDEHFQARGDKFVDFDWELSKQLNGVEKGNIVISPISLKVVLAMLYEGAQGKTAEEIADALDLDLHNNLSRRKTTRERFSAILKSLMMTSNDQYKIKMGTHVFVDVKAVPKERYQCKLQHYYNSDMQKVNFSDSASAIKIINNWASNATEGHIQGLLSESDDRSSTIMLLLNAVYFKGQWETPFPQNQTKTGPFHVSDKEHVDASFMKVTGKFGYVNMSDVDAQLVRLAYMGNKFAMYIVVPNEGTSLDKVANRLGPQKPLMDYITNNMTLATLNLILPKFEYDYTISLKDPLEQLGIRKMFTEQAELPDIAESKNGGLVVSNVLQKAGISVTEAGTVAAAVTAVELMDKFGGDYDVYNVTANRPFLFFIQDEPLKTSVFVGKVTNPGIPKGVEDKIASDPLTKPTPATIKPSKVPGAVDSTDDQGDRFGGNQDAITARSNYFDAELLKVIGSTEKGNFVISPASIKLLLALLIEGAEGSTLNELLTKMRLPTNIEQARDVLITLHTALQRRTSSDVTVDFVSKIFVSNKITPNSTYKTAIQNYYLTDISQEDFSSPKPAVSKINDWISRRTNGMIPKLLDDDMVTPDTLSVLTNAVHFDGKWKKEFKTEDSKEDCFYAEPDFECQKTNMMSKNDDLFYTYDPTLDSHIVQIPYKDTRFSMVIVMPFQKNGMKQLTLDANRLSFPDLVQKLKHHEVNLKMPSFAIEYGADLINTLKKMGIYEVFSDNARLPNMFKGKMGKVSAVVHKAKIEVNEKGTKAAAATGASVVPLSFGSEIINLEINHPFYYFIHERNSHGVMFAGRLSSMTGVSEQQVPIGGSPDLPYTDPDDIDHMLAESVGTHDPINKPDIKGPENQHYNQNSVPHKSNHQDSLLLS